MPYHFAENKGTMTHKTLGHLAFSSYVIHFALTVFIPVSLAGLLALSRILQVHPTWVEMICAASLPSSCFQDWLETGLHRIAKTSLEFPSS